MAQIDRPILPPYLYRYRRLSNDEIVAREIAAIKEQYIWLSKYRALNDPMEGLYEASRRLQAHGSYDEVAKELLQAKADIGICSFSDTKEDELMWVHYASDYAGICVAYRPQPLVDGLPDDAHLVRLAYGSTPPIISGLEVTDPQTAVRKILSHKKSNWGHEREWRVLGRPGRLNISSKSCAREVYLGARVKPEHKDKILSALRDVNVRIYEMQVSGYVHKWSPLKRLK